MRIPTIDIVAKKALPYVASAAIGLGALTSCSSENKTNDFSIYKEDIVMLDNKLDSLKQAKDEQKISFPEYYAKSKAVIKSPDYNKKPLSLTSSLSLAGIFCSAFGILGILGSTIKAYLLGSSKSLINFYGFCMGALCAGGITAGIGLRKDISDNAQEFEKVELYKNQKMKELDAQKTQFLELKGLDKDVMDML